NAVVVVTSATFLNKEGIAKGEKLSRRESLTRFIVNHENFTKAFVNRMWGHFFGHGLGELPAVDDFGEHNKIVHPELLDRLAKDFAGTGHYDPKHLIRWICNSDAYQLSCAVNKTNEKTEKFDPEPYFSRMILKSLSPEQLFESLLVATQAEKTA